MPFTFGYAIITPVLPVPYNAVLIDGKPWRYFDGHRVFLPRRPGVYRIQVRTEVSDRPHLVRTGASVESCEFDAVSGQLVVRFAGAVEGHTAWVSGSPVSVSGGAIITEQQNAYRVAERQLAMNRGTVLRLAGRVLRVGYRLESQ